MMPSFFTHLRKAKDVCVCVNVLEREREGGDVERN
jgi:hypothetical protein